MELSDYENAMAKGEFGEPRRFALEQQIVVGKFFEAADFVEISQVHLMADGEAVGKAGVEMLEGLLRHGSADCRLAVPTVTDPRGVDAKACGRLRQPQGCREREDRISTALSRMGALLTNTCINYQTICPPTIGEHVAFGDTGSSNYANSVCGARTNFEGGVAALWAGLTGRVPRYGMHLAERRQGTHHYKIVFQPESLSDWGALGALIGREMKSYFDIPVISGLTINPVSDQLKHFAAAIASYGSTPLFHMIGVTPEASDLSTVFSSGTPQPVVISRDRLATFYKSFRVEPGPIDIVVFSAPQLSLFELQTLANLLDGKRIHPSVTLIATTSPEIAAAADRMGLTERVTGAGGVLLEGVCFYQMYAREMGINNGWKRLVSNSAKLCNILGGYGYEPVLATMERCVDAAVEGVLR